MIFLTVGTQFPFDRLVKTVDNAFDHGLIEGELFAQIGHSSYQPRNFQSVRFLKKRMFDERLLSSSCVISHAGIGIITSALDYNKPLLVMPRRKKYGEVVNDHQAAIAKKFAQHGYILTALSPEDLLKSIAKLKWFVPRKRQNDAARVAARVSRFLEEMTNSGNGNIE